MGYYINQNSKNQDLPAIGKLNALIEDGAKVIIPNEFEENLVCVIDNGFFEAAAYMYNKDEFDYFKSDNSRPRKFLKYEHAKELAK